MAMLVALHHEMDLVQNPICHMAPKALTQGISVPPLSVSAQNFYLTALKISVILISYYMVILVVATNTFWKKSGEYLPNLLTVILQNLVSRKHEFFFDQWLLGP